MNNQSVSHDDEITLNISGKLAVSREVLKEIIRQLTSTAPAPACSLAVFDKLDGSGQLPRLAYTMKETAEILGVSYITVHRLVQRRLLRSSLATRRKMIPKKEIERFLDATMSEL